MSKKPPGDPSEGLTRVPDQTHLRKNAHNSKHRNKTRPRKAPWKRARKGVTTIDEGPGKFLSKEKTAVGKLELEGVTLLPRWEKGPKMSSKRELGI